MRELRLAIKACMEKKGGYCVWRCGWHGSRQNSRWVSCMPLKNKIVLNTELAPRPRICIDYVAAHELAHFFVPNHGEKFKLFMDRHLPDWRQTRRLLNSGPYGL